MHYIYLKNKYVYEIYHRSFEFNMIVFKGGRYVYKLINYKIHIEKHEIKVLAEKC